MAPGELGLPESTHYGAPSHTDSELCPVGHVAKMPHCGRRCKGKTDKHIPAGGCTLGALSGIWLQCCEEAQAMWRGLAKHPGRCHTHCQTHKKEAILNYWDIHSSALVTNFGKEEPIKLQNHEK